MEHRIIRKDGEVRWVQQFATVIFDEHVEPQYVDGTLYDITDRKRSEESLRENEERYRRIADNATDIIWTMDMNMRLTYVNCFASIFTCTLAEYSSAHAAKSPLIMT